MAAEEKAKEYVAKQNIHFRLTDGTGELRTTVLETTIFVGEPVHPKATARHIADWLERKLIEPKEDYDKRKADKEKAEKEAKGALKR